MAEKYAVVGASAATWDATNSPNIWFTTSGGSTPTTPPGASDRANFDANTGSGKITVGATISTGNQLGGINMSNYTNGGELDFSVNNPTINFVTQGMSGGGTGTRTLRLGSSVFNMAGAAIWDISNITNLTLSTGTASFNFTSTSITSTQTFSISTGNYSGCAVTVSGRANGTAFQLTAATGNSIGSITATGPLYFFVTANVTYVIGSLSLTGTLSAPIVFGFGTPQSTVTTMNVTSSSISYTTLRSITFGTSAVNATNSWDLGNNSMNGGSITPPAASSGGRAGVIG
jgi:hypothetical protein